MTLSFRRAGAWLWLVVATLGLAGCSDDSKDIATFTQQPAIVTVAEGATATFTVAVAPTSAPLQWFRNGLPIAGATSATYTTPPVTAADNGASFYVMATLDLPTGSNAATLTVTPAPPRITTPPANATVIAPATATFSVVAAGSGLAYQWQRGTTNITGATAASYTTPATTVADTGATFRVVVTNTGGSVTSPAATLTVNAPAPPPSAGIVPAVEAGGEFESYTVALKSNGTVWVWGSNGDGALGNGTTTASLAPVQVAGLPQVRQIAVGGGHVVALGGDGSVWAWGRNGFGQVGDGTNTNRLTPFRVTLPSAAVAVTAGTVHTVVVLGDGRAYAWGSNAERQLGDGTNVTRNTPVQVSGLTNAVDVAAGIFHTLARTSTGQVLIWGSGSNGQLGLGATTTAATPTVVPGIANAVAVGASSQNSAAIVQGGQLYAWGLDNVGQVGDGTPNSNRNAPVLVTGTFAQIQRGNSAQHMVGRLQGDTVVAWGLNDRGQVGNGTTVNASSPVAATGLANVTWVSAGAGHSAAARTDGSVYVWGGNNQGQLGIAGGNQSTPTLLPGFNLLQ
jgi:alpha-tubulin suppressor-like RCC1 family protein